MIEQPRMADLPPDQRPRERLQRLGADALTDAEVVAVLLGSGRAGRNVVDVAADVVRAAGGIAGLLSTSMTGMTSFSGLGPVAACRLRAAAELARRASKATRPPGISTGTDLAALVVPELVNRETERMVVAVLDRQLRCKDVATLAVGDAAHAAVPVAEVLRRVLRAGGEAFAVAHNHPGGTVAVSEADRAATVALRDGAAVCGLRFLDHLVVAGGDWATVKT